MNQLTTSPELHTFPVAPELENIDFIELAEQARARFMGELATTTLEPSPLLSHGSNQVYVKRTDELPGANFKYLSAMTAVADLLQGGHTEFALATAGSYGIGVGHAVKTYGGIATAFVPEGTNPKKQELMADMGVRVREYGRNFDESLEEARQYAARRDIKLLHPFADVSNIAGTGVIGLELLEQSPDMTHVVLPFGGGSLFGGVASVIKQERPEVEVIAVQASACSPVVNALETGDTSPVKDPLRFGKSFFKKLGGVGVGNVDMMTLGLASQSADRTHKVEINHVYGTMHNFKQAHGVLPEAAAAHGLEAAAQFARSPVLEGATIVVPLTGANPDEYSEGYLERQAETRGNPFVVY